MSQEPDWGYDPWLMEGGPLRFLGEDETASAEGLTSYLSVQAVWAAFAGQRRRDAGGR
jgi:hypothetical protein